MMEPEFFVKCMIYFNLLFFYTQVDADTVWNETHTSNAARMV